MSITSILLQRLPLLTSSAPFRCDDVNDEIAFSFQIAPVLGLIGLRQCVDILRALKE